jgi:hypothetical protein
VVFNRPVQTARVLARIAQARPRELLVIADGPRSGNAAEARNCAAVRALIDRIDWCPRIHRIYSDSNLGCKTRLSTGLSELFARTEEAIVIEDDCLPDPSFFRYCDELLERFRSHEHVMSIGGTNFQYGWPCDTSYFPTRFAHVWGWASWRRAWKRYDVAMADWPLHRADPVILDLPTPHYRQYWTRIFDMVHTGQIDTWDFQWTYAHMRFGGVSVAPHVNLVENIGFERGATHTARVPQWLRQPAASIEFPLRHADVHVPDSARDDRTFYCCNLLRPPRLPIRLPRWAESMHKKLPGWRWRHVAAMRTWGPPAQKRTRPALPRGGSPV